MGSKDQKIMLRPDQKKVSALALKKQHPQGYGFQGHPKGLCKIIARNRTS
jgi:hypothetical protein